MRPYRPTFPEYLHPWGFLMFPACHFVYIGREGVFVCGLN